MPWKLLADPNGYIFTWLVGYSALLGPVAGILLTDYFIVRRCHVVVEELYQLEGRYTYQNGFNPAAIWALILGVLPNIPGFLVQIQVLSKDAVPEVLVESYAYAWFIGLALASLIYWGLMKNMQPLSVSSVAQNEVTS
jgi:NCS1 family nucleobase:cation symporter-1